MKRRNFCQGLLAGWGLATTPPLLIAAENHDDKSQASLPPLDPSTALRMQEKIDHYNKDFDDDIYLTKPRLELLKAVLGRLNKTQNFVGYGRFNIFSFDELLRAAALSPEVGAFTKEELAFIEEIFFTDAKTYGFYGEKVTNQLTTSIADQDTIKISGSGHYLYRGRPEELYKTIVRDVGNGIVLTSGIRSVVKQLHLFLAKAVQCDGNLSRASRSLAPPGHSFHGVSDFDVGKIGWGYRNFTDQFAETEVFKKLIDLGYVDIRYTRTNPYGVRFEPWHIKVS